MMRKAREAQAADPLTVVGPGARHWPAARAALLSRPCDCALCDSPADDCHPAYRDLAVLSGRVPEAVVFLCPACRGAALGAGRASLPGSPYLWLWVGVKVLARARNRWPYVAPADEYVRSRARIIKATRKE